MATTEVPLEEGSFFKIDNTHTDSYAVKTNGTVYNPTENCDDMYLGDTSVIECDGAVYRAVAVRENGKCNFYSLKTEDEEALIQRAVTTAPGLKLSWTRWVSLAKSKTYPANATALERAVFGPHCILSETLVAKRVARKRDRDTASRNRRRKLEAPDEPPPKVAKTPEPTENGVIRLTLEIPAATVKAVDLIQRALGGMIGAMPP